MDVMGALLAVVVVAGVAGWVIVKNDELSGIGRNVRPGSFRSPHGRLVHVKALGPLPPRVPFRFLVRESFPLVSCLCAFALGVLALLLPRIPGAADAASVLLRALSTPLPAVVIAAEALFRSREGKRLVSAYIIALAGAFMMQLLCFLVPVAIVWAAQAAGAGQIPPEVAIAAPFLISPFAFALGSAVAAARTGRMVKFRRRFADGSENEIEVSTNGVAYGAYRALMEQE